MIDKSQTVEDVRKQTMDLLGITDPSEVAYIDEQFLTEEGAVIPSNLDEKTVTRVFGHNTAYVRGNDGKFYYRFNAAGSGTNYPTTENMACGGSVWHVPQDYWHHTNLSSTCPGGNGPRYQKARFDRR